MSLYLQSYTAEEIGELVGLNHSDVSGEIRGLTEENADLRKSQKVTFSDDFAAPVYVHEKARHRFLSAGRGG